VSRAVTGLTGGRPATFTDYKQLFSTVQRPEKFSAEEAGFTPRATQRGMPPCSDCIHWYQNPRTGRAVCEVVRLTHEMDIRPGSTCRFQTADGITYPLLRVL